MEANNEIQLKAGYMIEQSDRTCTDKWCAILGAVATPILLITALILFNYGQYSRSSFPSDSDGKICGIDLPNYPIVYFANFPEITRRVCVVDCPSQKDEQLKCQPTQSIGCRFSNSQLFSVKFYPSSVINTNAGYYCLPIDADAKQQFLDKNGLSARMDFFNQINRILLCAIVAVAVSILYCFLVQLIPMAMNYFSVIIGLIIMFTVLIITFLYPSSRALKICVLTILLLMIIMIIFIVVQNKGNLKYHAVFLKYSARMVADRPGVIVYILIFMAALFLFVFIVLVELRAFWSSGKLVFDMNNIYYEFTPKTTIIWTCVVAVQAIWGISFLKEAFNFCVSGNALNWYLDEKDRSIFSPLQIMFTAHFGSVVGASFMTAFFSIGDFIFDCMRPDPSLCPQYYTNCFNAGFSWLEEIFSLVRSDSLTFVQMAGKPYCNSARYCEYLNDKTIIARSSQSTSRSYRFCAHLLIAGILAIVSLYINGIGTSFYVMLFVIVQTVFISTLFISLHADAAEALQLILLNQEYLEKRNSQEKATEGFLVKSRMQELAKDVKKVYDTNAAIAAAAAKKQ